MSKPIRAAAIALVLLLSGLLAAKTATGIDLLYRQAAHDLESLFVTNPRALVPMLVGQLFLLSSFFLRSNLFIRSGLVAMGIGFLFFLDPVYKELTGLQVLFYTLFAACSIALYWWCWKADRR